MTPPILITPDGTLVTAQQAAHALLRRKLAVTLPKIQEAPPAHVIAAVRGVTPGGESGGAVQ